MSLRFIFTLVPFLFAICLAGGILVFSSKPSAVKTSLLFSLSAGIFAGMVISDQMFFVAARSDMTLYILLSIVGVMVVDYGYARRSNDTNLMQTRQVWILFSILCLNSVLYGIYSVSQISDPALRIPFSIISLIQKLSEALILGAILRNCNFPQNKAIILIVIFSALTPISIITANTVAQQITPGLINLVAACSLGILLYALFMLIIPIMFNTLKYRFLVLSGFAFGCFLTVLLF